MAGSKTAFEQYVADSVQKLEGVYFPLKASLLARILTKKAPCKRLYPNPADEFCMPDIGPSEDIISSYAEQFLENLSPSFCEPIIIEKLHPEGYMIINGHHRWAAAWRTNHAKIPVRVVNLMHEAEVREILQNSRHEKRATFDMDEVLLRGGDEALLEKPLPFPWNRIYRERIRLGVPALFHSLMVSGYDIWLYSTRYYSADAVQDYFRRYHVEVTGVITALDKRRGRAHELEEMIHGNYRCTLNIDNDTVLLVMNGEKELREFPLSGAPDTWSREIIELLKELDQEPEETGVGT